MVVGWTTGSPQFYQWLESNALLPAVLIEVNNWWIELQDVSIEQVSQTSSNGRFVQEITFQYDRVEGGTGAAGHELQTEQELIAFALSFMNISISGVSGGKAFQDDWSV